MNDKWLEKWNAKWNYNYGCWADVPRELLIESIKCEMAKLEFINHQKED